MTVARTGISRTRFITLPTRDRQDGGGGDNDIDIDDEIDAGDDDEGDDDDEGGDGGEGWKPPSKEEFEALAAQLARANKQAKDRRLELRRLKENGNGGKPKDDEGGDGKPVDEERLRARIESETIGVWKPLVVRGQASAALKEAGLIGEPKRLLKMLDMDEIDVDPDTGELDGLEEQVADLKREYPHLFRRSRSRNLDAADKGERGRRSEKMSASQIQAAQLRGDL